jgi:hypothetical protein
MGDVRSGGGVIAYAGLGSLVKLVYLAYPEHKWEDWRFAKVQVGKLDVSRS